LIKLCQSSRQEIPNGLKTMSSASESADRLARRAAKIYDSSVRVAYIRHSLQQMDVVQVADLITVAKANAETRNFLYSKLLLYISLALADDSCDQLRHAVAMLLDSRDQHDLSKLLVQSSDETNQSSFAVPDFGLKRQITLGERKSLARRTKRDVIARAIHDPQPSVIRILLDNPALTESDVLRLCSKRPIFPDVLREVFRNWRWIVRYDVKMAIILNPDTPLDVSLQLVPHLKAQDLRRVITAPNLPKEIYEACQRSTPRGNVH
jgi:hypothetical protein